MLSFLLHASARCWDHYANLHSWSYTYIVRSDNIRMKNWEHMQIITRWACYHKLLIVDKHRKLFTTSDAMWDLAFLLRYRQRQRSTMTVAI